MNTHEGSVILGMWRRVDIHWSTLRRVARRHNLNSNILYVLPALIVYLLYVAWPIISVFRDSLYRWDGISRDKVFLGFANYRELLFADRFFRNAITNNVLWFFITVGLCILFGFILAYVLNMSIRFRNIYRTLIFLPLTASGVVVSLAWNNIYNFQFGIVNVSLRSIGLGGLVQDWLGNPSLALYAILVAAVWRGTGSHVIMYLAALQGISTEMLEAAMIDGANGLQRMWYIAIPLVRGTTAALLILGAIGAVGAFDLVYLMTRGGPYHATELIALRVFDLAFVTHRTGYASALSVLLVLIAGVITVFQVLRYRGAPGAQ
jgi:raffinose/stachyose/melibiose transport system permease protein